MPRGPCERTLAIALGANLDDPGATLAAVRPLLAAELVAWAGTPPLGVPQAGLQLHWSPLFRTAPVGGPPGQPPYLNAVLLVHHSPLTATGSAMTTSALPAAASSASASACASALPAAAPAAHAPWPAAEELLRRLQRLEAAFGRERSVHWGPRTLDLDLLWCGHQVCCTATLTLPHPRLRERAFVLAPLAALDPLLIPPGSAATAAELLAAALRRGAEPPPRALAGVPGWPDTAPVAADGHTGSPQRAVHGPLAAP